MIGALFDIKGIKDGKVISNTMPVLGTGGYRLCPNVVRRL